MNFHTNAHRSRDFLPLVVHRFEMAEIVLKNVEARGAIGSGKNFGIF